MIKNAVRSLAIPLASIGFNTLAQPVPLQRGVIPYTLEFNQVYGDTSPTPQPVIPPPPRSFHRILPHLRLSSLSIPTVLPSTRPEAGT